MSKAEGNDKTVTDWKDAWTNEEGATRANALFEAAFNYEPNGIWSAPGRVNLIGEHTDYNGGLALPIALKHRTYVAYAPREDRQVRLVSAQEKGETVAESIRTLNLDNVGKAGSDKEVSGWPAYVVGVAWAIEQSTGIKLSGLDLAVDSCVPYGAGLSSSAALEAPVALAILDADPHVLDMEFPLTQVVQWCITAENEIAGAATGGMDQSASLRCKPGHALGLDCLDSSTVDVPFMLGTLGLELLVIDTKAPHSLNDGQYEARRRKCEEAASRLGIKYLREVEDLDLALSKLSDEESVKRTRHVITEIARTEEAIKLALSGGLDEEKVTHLGKLFNASHYSLRDDYEVSCPELDTAQETALAAGALGARMTGGGFGGSAIAIVPKAQAEDIAGKIAKAFDEKGYRSPVFLRADASEPAKRDR